MRIFTALLLVLSSMTPADSIAGDWPAPSGPYFGLKPPGLIPEMFAQFLADSGDHKHSAPIFTSDGTEMYFSVYLNDDFPQKILVTRQVNNAWTKPEIAEFSGTYQDGGPILTADDNRLYYYSKRPFPGKTEPSKNSYIWYVNRVQGGWSEPRLFSEFAGFEQGAVPGGVSVDGSVYGSVKVPDSVDYDLWVARRNGDRYEEPTLIPDPISKPGSYDFRCLFTDNEKTMIFSSVSRHRPGSADIYLSTRQPDFTWSEPIRMGDMINRGDARFASFSPDGKYFFFASYRSGPEELYWVDAKIIDYLKTEDLNLIDQMKETILESGKQAALAQYERFKQKYAGYYLFDKELFGTAAEEFLDDKRPEAAGLAFEINREIFDEPITPIQQFRIALQSRNEIQIDSLVLQLDSLSKLPGNTIEQRVNLLGYRLIRIGLIPEAMRALKLNTSLFPESGNVFDSYAESLLTSGDTTGAIENYRQSLMLTPDNENAKQVLSDLGVSLE